MENISQELPEDLQRLILSWMPLKSLMKFKCVSKNWASLISKKDFEDLYLDRSKTRPRVLFAFRLLSGWNPNILLYSVYHDILFYSVYQDEKLLLSSGQQHMRTYNQPGHKVSAPIRGLVCLKSGTKVNICNPSTRKFRALPEIGDTKFFQSFLGYDEVTKVFKVLCTLVPSSKPHESPKYQALTLGLGEESWRPLVCKHYHYPISNGVWIGEVMYYGALSGSMGDPILFMSFNIRSEELIVIDSPKEVHFHMRRILVNYNGNIAYVENSLIENGVIKMLVRNEISGVWLEECIVINPGWKQIFGIMGFSFVGIIGAEELVLGGNELAGSHILVYKRTDKFREFVIDGGGSDHFIRTFLNHVDSLSLP